MKYIVGLFFLLGSNILLAQEVNYVIYERHHYEPNQGEITIKKSGKKKITYKKETVVEDREAQLIYSPNYLLFISAQGTDTALLSKINFSMRNSFLDRKIFHVLYNDKEDYITFSFCKRKNAKKFKRFMLDNGGQFKRCIGANILLGSLLVLFAPLGAIDPFAPSWTSSWSRWEKTCDASKK